ncbi:phosphate acyltransferase PlsX [Desulfobaculum bizertense]|uniref:Phosphate acyltransferase n=1 Tax=Desulfobaculum bizertense DSM 18034 TaxID=1121442 RepID=A0A1T4VEA9_9BACT|nr:phosphate acyltransferase PlsX [Desulfobaculum bizertense]UIJ37654.1 phosphate acyltransferase PlsX [Desulfobaculum bizertense]SKA63314.1 phosphate:acyl-[acyl carrier protein] acyltransferase [Desulfobaculum bizertense DSM 18034]
MKPSNKPRIAVDAMGGDSGPSVVVPGAVEAARRHNLAIVLVGDESSISTELYKLDTTGLDISIVHAGDVAEMSEKPSEILRRKTDTSIQVACRLVKDGAADGVVSAGHSGATAACGMFIIGRIRGVKRPAFASVLPTVKKPMVLLDVGANVDSKPQHLFQFAIMGDVFARDVLGYNAPSVGLMSIGEEEGKGNSTVRKAFELIRDSAVSFRGNVEGRDVFTGDVDVIVCDGFVGNVVLKLSEGLGSSLGKVLKRELLGSWLGRIGTFLAKGRLKRFAKFVDYAEYGGAPILGLNGIVIVSHGSSNQKAITNAVKMGGQFVLSGANEHLKAALQADREILKAAG